MIQRTALLASLLLVAGAPCGAQPPAQTPAAPSSAAASGVAASSTASSPATAPAPAKVAAGADAAATGSKPASSAADATSEPSAAVLKEARREGFKPKKRDGVTMFCHSDATLGTRFETEKCYDQHHMEMLVQQREDMRDQMRQPGACAGSSCSGH